MEIEEELVQPEQNAPLEPLSLEALGDKKLADEKPNLDGRQATIRDISLVPKAEEQQSRDGMHTYRDVLVRLTYQLDDLEVLEHVGGMKQFKHGEDWGEPTFRVGGNSQLAEMFRLWLSKTGRQPQEVSVKSFLQNLIGTRCTLKSCMVGYQGREFRKDLVEVFV